MAFIVPMSGYDTSNDEAKMRDVGSMSEIRGMTETTETTETTESPSTLENNFKETFGSWVQAIGTVVSAIANPPAFVPDDEASDNLDLIGNTLQGTGNAVVADGEEPGTLDQAGNAIQAIGNSTVITGLLRVFPEETSDILIINGNFIQALGGGVSAADITENEPYEGLNIAGNLLQLLGNSLQGLAGIIELKNGDSQQESGFQTSQGEEVDPVYIQVLGSWIQAIGAVLTLIAQLLSNAAGGDEESP